VVRRSAKAALLTLVLALVGCSVNPVTGENELMLVPESWELNTGEQQYDPARQMQGGDLVADPGLTEYVQYVGQRVAGVSDRDLPYEFVVLNNGTPNAWALPGGKIAVNRGLLTELGDEAELAAVLGHEVVHAAARHGAQRYQSGLLTQLALIGVRTSVQGREDDRLIVGGATLGAMLINSSYSRDAESEADRYGMVYMQRAGYDPAAAVDLQRTFVRLSEGRDQGWLAGLFASHPPSPARVARNQRTLAELGAGGDRGADAYLAATAQLREHAEDYAALDRAAEALADGDVATARTIARRLRGRMPGEPMVWGLSADAAAAAGEHGEALEWLDQAIRIQPDYYRHHLVRGRSLLAMGRTDAARNELERANQLLPTAGAHLALGSLAERRGDANTAMQHYQAAAGSQSEVGSDAGRRLARLAMPRDPARYFAVGLGIGQRGRLLLQITNRSPVADVDVVVRVQVLSEAGAVVTTRDFGHRVRAGDGATTQLTTDLGGFSSTEQLTRVRAEVIRATPN
jgi:predicted Zn-dependent protease